MWLDQNHNHVAREVGTKLRKLVLTYCISSPQHKDM
jgi:hypothetical protein